MDITVEKFTDAGFSVLKAEECYRKIRFLDVGALVWFARIIPWEFPDFSVQTHLPQLQAAQKVLEREGALEGRTHRFLLVAQK